MDVLRSIQTWAPGNMFGEWRVLAIVLGLAIKGVLQAPVLFSSQGTS